jgi:hypothetical protein
MHRQKNLLHSVLRVEIAAPRAREDRPRRGAEGAREIVEEAPIGGLVPPQRGAHQIVPILPTHSGGSAFRPLVRRREGHRYAAPGKNRFRRV